MRFYSKITQAISSDNGISFHLKDGYIAEEYITPTIKKTKWFYIFFSILNTMLVFYLIFKLLHSPTPITQLLTIVYICCLIISFFLCVNFMSTSKKRFHGAEHMALNACRKLNRVPSIDEIRRFSRYNRICGTNLAIAKILIFIVLLICSNISIMNIRLTYVAIGFFITFVVSRIGLLNFFQFFTTEKPTNRELEIAIKGIQKAFEHVSGGSH